MYKLLELYFFRCVYNIMYTSEAKSWSLPNSLNFLDKEELSRSLTLLTYFLFDFDKFAQIYVFLPSGFKP